MGLFGSSVKKHLTPEERSLYYMTLQDLNNILGFNYIGSLLLNSKYKIIEKHLSKTSTRNDFGECITGLFQKFKKFKKVDRVNIPQWNDVIFPFEKLIISLKGKYLLLVMGEKLTFALYVGKENLNAGSVLNIIFPKITELLEKLESTDK